MSSLEEQRCFIILSIEVYESAFCTYRGVCTMLLLNSSSNVAKCFHSLSIKVEETRPTWLRKPGSGWDKGLPTPSTERDFMSNLCVLSRAAPPPPLQHFGFTNKALIREGLTEETHPSYHSPSHINSLYNVPQCPRGMFELHSGNIYLFLANHIKVEPSLKDLM